MHDKWNPWHGCKKCSPGCQNCYMYCLDEMRGLEETASSEVKRTKNFDYPLKKDRQKNYKIKSGERIMVNMTSDTFIEDADEWRDEMWDIIRQRPDVIFWLLTKRPERIKDHLPKDWGDGWENVSLNVTCENQEMFDKRIPIMIDIPAKHKGICIAPMIGPVDVTLALKSGKFEEISCGGENYNNPRPCYYEWVESISKQCEEYKINFCWYESGTNLIRDNRQIYMPKKIDQARYSYMADLSRKFYDVNYKLTDLDGNPIPKEELYHKKYNIDKCIFCANRMVCNGCSGCGDCGMKNIQLVTLEEIWKREEELLKPVNITDK